MPRLLPPILSLTLLAIMAFRDPLRIDPSPAKPFHDRVRLAVSNIPRQVGDFTSEDLPIPPGAVTLLKPNAMLTRLYTNPLTNTHAFFLVVQSRDSRDMRGHCPAICYPANGWSIDASPPISLDGTGFSIRGREYALRRETAAGVEHLFVRSFFVLPDGRTVPDMEDVVAAAKDYRKLSYGAAQIQVVLDPDLDSAKREAIFASLMRANAPLIRTMEAGVNE